jgi:hypothetical protein
VVRERPTEGNAVSSEEPEEAVAHRFHLHVVPKHPLPGVKVIHSRGQKRHQGLSAESDALIGAQCEMGRKDWEAGKENPSKV